MAAYNLSAIIQLLNPDNTISAHRMLAHAIGMTETIIYSALISKQTYYSQNGMLLEGGWFFSTVYDLQESTTFGTKAQQTAIKHLIEHGMIECESKGLPARRHFRIVDDTENLMRLIEAGIEISQSIISRSKAKNSEKSQRRGGKLPDEKIQFEQQKQPQEITDVPAAVSCSDREDISCCSPSAVPCSCPSAGTSTSLAHYKSKDNNPKKKNPKIMKSINRSSNSENPQTVESVEKTDRTNCKPMKFTEVMEALSLKWYEMTANEPKSEKHFDEWDEISRHTQKCKIPYTLKDDKRNMKAALRFLCGYSYYFKEANTEQQRTLWETIICSLAEMTEGEYVLVRGNRVMYYEIIDRLNEIISRSYLSECFAPYEERTERIILYKWNRRYPADLVFGVNLNNGWRLIAAEDFQGNSHEKITEEIYERSN